MLPPSDTHRSALLFDEYDSEVNDGGDIATDDSNEDGDLNSLMDRGLEEVDDLLNTKGRISGRAKGPLKLGVMDTGHSALSSPVVDGPENGACVTLGESTRTTGEAREQRKGASTRGSTETPPEINARGTDAHAARVLMSATAPAGSAGSVSAAAHHPTAHAPISMQRALGGSSSEALMNGGDDAAAYAENGAPSGDAEPTRRQGAVQPYHNGAKTTSGVGINGLPFSSPPGRRATEEVPFIQAKGLSLTYAQARLFGLAGPPLPGASFADEGFRVAHSNNKRDTSWRASSFKRPENFAGGNGTGLNGGLRDGRSRRRKQDARACTYSPSRMDHLAQPVPGRTRVNDTTPAFKAAAWGRSAGHPWAGEGGAGEEARFTWKRSRKAEAAMR